MSEPKYRDVILSRMFIAGEPGEPTEETTTLVENIVQGQIRDMLSVAKDLAARRGSTRFTANDILFQLRHDPARIGRLRDHLRWHRIRSTAAKCSKDAVEDTTEADLLDEDDDALNPDEVTINDSDTDTTRGAKNTNNKRPHVAAEASDMAIIQPPWSVTSFFPHASELFSDIDFDNDDDNGNGHSQKRGPDQGSNARLTRLLKNDERTRAMTSGEYHVWTEARISSFSHRRKATFREWCGLGVIADHRVTDDVPGLLNMLACEWVQLLTEEALRVQRREGEIWRAQARKVIADRPSEGQGPFVITESSGSALAARVEGDVANGGRPLIEPRHVRIAFERLQVAPKRAGAMLNGTRIPRPKRLRLW